MRGKSEQQQRVRGSGVQVLSEVAFCFAEIILLLYNSGIDARMIYLRENSNVLAKGIQHKSMVKFVSKVDGCTCQSIHSIASY